MTPNERLRVRCILDALVAQLYGLTKEDFAWILRDCDHPAKLISNSRYARAFDPKGFWRVDKEQDPELRHPVLAQIAFHDMQARGLDAFLAQNDGEGWMLPETLRLADYGLGHDERARHPQPVASRLGPRFYDWQLAQTAEESWRECHLHARNLLGEAGYKKLLARAANFLKAEGQGLMAAPDLSAAVTAIAQDY